MVTSEIIYRGRCFDIVGIAVNGTCHVREFIEHLDEANTKKVFALLQRAAEGGLPRNTEKFRHLEEKIYEFKSYQVRLLCFLEKGRVVVLTHGFMKKKDRTPRAEIEKAKGLMASYQGRKM